MQQDTLCCCHAIERTFTVIKRMKNITKAEKAKIAEFQRKTGFHLGKIHRKEGEQPMYRLTKKSSPFIKGYVTGYGALP